MNHEVEVSRLDSDDSFHRGVNSRCLRSESRRPYAPADAGGDSRTATGSLGTESSSSNSRSYRSRCAAADVDGISETDPAGRTHDSG